MDSTSRQEMNKPRRALAFARIFRMPRLAVVVIAVSLAFLAFVEPFSTSRIIAKQSAVTFLEEMELDLQLFLSERYDLFPLAPTWTVPPMYFINIPGNPRWKGECQGRTHVTTFYCAPPTNKIYLEYNLFFISGRTMEMALLQQ